jgi:hypothetical protein
LSAARFNVTQVVHDYGDICHAITEIAIEQHAPITVEEFHTLNRCLDTAIAEAVTPRHAARQWHRPRRSRRLGRQLHTECVGQLGQKERHAVLNLLVGDRGPRPSANLRSRSGHDLFAINGNKFEQHHRSLTDTAIEER